MTEFPRIPTATYRLQFHAGFTFRDARDILDYLDELGISDVYASPYFQSAPDSTHGYDVADHNRLNPAIGDDSDFRSYISELRRREMGQVLDFVPNHMGIGESLNQWWMDVLEYGSLSRYGRYFDIDWHSGREALHQRVLLPILGDRYGVVLEKGELKPVFEKGFFSLQYFQTRLPLSPASYAFILRRILPEIEGPSRDVIGELIAKFETAPDGASKRKLGELAASDPSVGEAITRYLERLSGKEGDPHSFDELHDVLERQSYRLSYWRVAAEEINYRRFFDINTLAAIRVEIPEVFEAAHRLVFELLSRGDVTGLRIDHVDGLWDPKAYFQRLQERYSELCGRQGNSLYLVVEKILEVGRERLPADWPVNGTTGYEFTNQAVQLFTDASAEKKLTKIYQSFTGLTESFVDLVYEKKTLTMQISLSSEVAALGRMLNELSELHRHYRDFTLNTLTLLVREVIACFPVYRTYATSETSLSADDERVVLRAISAARRRNPSIEKPVFDFLRNILLLRFPEDISEESREAHMRFVMKFQQCSGPVMAKGLEDTVFYIFNRLIALNEVGGNPGLFGIGVEDFHRLNAERQERFPHSMLATSTHDTKRSEDVRMRAVAISEIAKSWQQAVKTWSRINKKHRTKVDGEYAPSRNEEYLFYQSLAGVWPLHEDERENLAERLQQYMMKALKEAKVNSSWTEPNEAWEEAAKNFVEKVLADRAFLHEFEPVAERLAEIGALNSLSQCVLKCTSPGVPDIYQGTEIWDFSLVDPDNRRPVDYAARKALLAESKDKPIAELMKDWKTGAVKLVTLHRLLAFRRKRDEFFRQASYHPLKVTGPKAQHVVAYMRKAGDAELITVVPRLCGGIDFSLEGSEWEETVVELPGKRTWKNLLAATQTDLPAKASLKQLWAEIALAVLHSEHGQ
jgi:(1->4)-alpha-D-glucan 1-alpha-D-glucosylmutase